MNQTRVFLILAWLMVATLLWMEWGKEKAAPPAPMPAAAATTNAGAVPTAVAPAAPGAIPSAPSMSATPTSATASVAAAPLVTVTTDVLKVELDGGVMHRADLLKYPSTSDDDSAPVRLFAEDPTNYFVAQTGWVSSNGAAPTHERGFLPESAQRDFALAQGAKDVVVPFVWTGPDGVTIRRTYTFTRGDYVVRVHDEVVNAGSKPGQGFVYRQLSPVPPALVTPPASGQHPHITPDAAFYQVDRIARARGLSPNRVHALIERSIEQPILGFLGEPRVNVLEINRRLDGISANQSR